MPSRRAVLATVSTVSVAAVAGCSNLPGGTTDDRDDSTDEQSAFVARLVGPETERRLFDETGVVEVGSIREDSRLPVELDESATDRVRTAVTEAGVADDPDPFEVVLVHEGETVGRYGIRSSLAEAIAGGRWDGGFLLLAGDRETAENLRETLADA